MQDDRRPGADLDQFQLQRLAAAYADAVDRRDPDALAALFTEDASLAVVRDSGTREFSGEGIRGITETVARYEKTFHMLGQALYEVDERRATGLVYCVANHLKEGVNTVMYIRYHDKYVCDDAGAWRFERRELVVDWVETRPTDAR